MLRRITKFAAVLFVVLFTLSLAACGTATSSPTVAPTTAPSVAASSAAVAASSTAAATATATEPVITIKGAIVMEPVQADTIKTDPVAQFIKNKFGIILNVVDCDASSSWQQKAPAAVAANDLPDIFELVSQGAAGIPGFMQTCIKADAILPLDDLIAKDCPNITSNVYMNAALQFQKAFTSPDGKVYGFPTCVGIFDNPKAPAVNNYIRWDAYKAAGYPKITDDTSLLAALKKMQDVAPNDKNGKKPYAISGWFAESGAGWGDWEISNGEGMNNSSSSGIIQQMYGSTELNSVDNLTDPKGSFWTTVNFFYQANQMGILDPDSFTTKWDDWNTKVENGSVLWLNAGWIPGQKNATIQKNIGPDAGFVPLPSFDPNNFAAKVWNVGGQDLYGISKNSPYADRIAELMNWVCSDEGSLILNNGPENAATWTMVNGKPVATADYLKKSQFDLDMEKTYGANLYHHFKGFSDGTVLPTYGTTANLRLSSQAIAAQATSFENDALKFYGATSFDAPNYLGTKGSTYAYPLSSALGVLPDNLQQEATTISNYFYTNEYKAVLAKNDTDYAAIQASMIKFAKANGADDILAWALGKESAVKAKLDPVCQPIIDALSK